jgi:hypothetical protein
VKKPENIILVVQTPNREGPGHEFLVASMNLSDFDRSMWKQGKSDELILSLAQMSQRGIGHWRVKIGMKTFVRSIKDEYEIKEKVRRVKLDFVLPTDAEIVNAALRWNRIAIAEQVAGLEEHIMGCDRFITATQNKLKEYRTYLKQPNILSGIRLHFERVLIADRKKDLRDVRNERKRTFRELQRTQVLQKTLNDKEEIKSFQDTCHSL